MEKRQLPRKRARKRRNGLRAGGLPHRRHRGHVWTRDFLFDRTEAGEVLKILIVLDEYTRECHGIQVGTSMDCEAVQETLEVLFETIGTPDFVRSDYGPERIARALQEWLRKRGTGPIYIMPGHPWENPFAESFIGRFRDECLNEEIFYSPQEAQLVVEGWRQEYNERRPRSSLGYRTPKSPKAPCGRPRLIRSGHGARTPNRGID